MLRRAAYVLILLLAIILLGACSNSGSSRQPTPAPAWRPPTPFPPLRYQTTAPSPELPVAIRNRTPVAASGVNNLRVKIEGRFQQDLMQVETDVAKLRGFVPKEQVPEYFVTKDQMRAELLSEIDTSFSPEEARQEELKLWLLRLIDQPSIGLYQLQANLLSDQVVGLYAPYKKELFVRDSQLTLDAASKETLAHEFIHSLQDQYYNLQKLLPAHAADTDRSLAVKSLIEGDATLSALLYAGQSVNSTEVGTLLGSEPEYTSSLTLTLAPNIFRENLLFPYTKGVDFVKTLYKRGGFITVNAALADPPKSSEQILHSEKYLQTPRDEPLPVGLPALTATLGAGWTYKSTTTVGEFDLDILLRDNDVADTKVAVAGWGGGQLDFYENGPNSLVLLGTRWDTQKDAAEFDTALRWSMRTIPKFGPFWSDSTRYFTEKRIGDRVIYVGGTDRTATQAVLTAVK